MDAALRAGIAVYDAGYHHAAHDAWEPVWLDLDQGSDDERLLHGLIQFTAAVYHARSRNWSGATGLATSAREYLAGLPDDYRGVNVDAVRRWLADLAADPERVERARPLALTHGSTALDLDELDFDAAAVAAVVLAERGGYDESVVDDAVAYAREELDTAESRFVALVFDFVGGERRALVYDRLRRHVERRRQRDSDVEGLF
jgi:predicted metal-dependent hydrolase